MHPDFTNIEPYCDQDIPAAIQRIIADPQLPILIQNACPGMDIPGSIAAIGSVRTMDELHHKVILPLLLHVMQHSIHRFSYDGQQYLDPQKKYLFVSNHRDIFLDAALLNYVLMRSGIPVTEIAIGDNLMPNQLFKDFARANGMFPILRGGTRREMFQASMLVSSYIRYALTEKGRSVWIAQRNGRAKDGDDRTEPGLLKMFSMSGGKDFVENMEELNIVPVSISYECEPCADRKVHELHVKRRDGQYVKSPGEDTTSIIQGIVGQKKEVHCSICQPITHDELAQCAAVRGDEGINAPFHALAALIDRRIHAAYHLFPSNLEAHERLRALPDDMADSEEALLLRLYANPVANQEAVPVHPQ